MHRLLVLVLMAAATVSSFTLTAKRSTMGQAGAKVFSKRSALSSMRVEEVPVEMEGTKKASGEFYSEDEMLSSAGQQFLSPAVLGVLALLFLPLEGAQANQYGIFAGKTASLIHPTVMAALFGTSLYSGYLGLQWRRLRGLSDEIKELQKQGPVLSTGPAKFPIVDSISAIDKKITEMSVENDADAIAVLKKDIDALKGASAVDAQITELNDLRTTLRGAKLKDKHEMTGSYLLGAGVTVAVLGAFNTYMRAGKLFPGPHLYGGMAVTILWAVAASLTPAMQKGNDNARSAHIALNTINVALFAWQVTSGITITLKVWEKAPWP